MAMRIDRTRTTIFWILTIVLCAGLNRYFAVHPMYRFEAHQIDRSYAGLEKTLQHARESGRPVTLVVGNSYAASSLITGTDFPPDVGHFSTGGMSLNAVVDLVEHLPGDAPVGLLVVGLGYNYATPLEGGQRMYRTHWTRNPLARCWYGLPMVRSGDSSSNMLKFTLSEMLARRGGGSGRGGGAGEPDGEKDLLSAEHRAFVHGNARERYREYVPFTGHVKDSLPRLVTRLKGICDRRGIRLLTFTAPIHRDVRDRLDPGFLESFREAVRGTGAAYVDLNLAFPDWDESHFDDATHTSRIGRQEVRERVKTLVGAEFPGGDFPLW